MDEKAILEALEYHWAQSGKDEIAAHEIYHEDAILEFPQSGERFEGKANFLAWRQQYPSKLEFRQMRKRGRADLWVAENLIKYDNGPWNFTVNILEFRGDKVAHETVYVTEGWKAPEWRAQWRQAP